MTSPIFLIFKPFKQLNIMADPFIAEIRIFPFNFAPRGWAFCNGQLIPTAQNTALFSLIGVTYGGNGASNFGLPNMQGSAPMQPRQGPGLSPYDLGNTGGSQTVTLLTTHMPNHSHGAFSSSINSQIITPAGNATGRGNPTQVYTDVLAPGSMGPNSLAPTGGNQPHNNMMPYLTLNFNIALEGIFPTRI